VVAPVAPSIRGTRHARPTRRALLGAALASAGGIGVAGCALPWQTRDRRAPLLPAPASTPVRFGPVRLRLVLAQEGLASLDTEVRAAVESSARELGYTVEVQDAASFGGVDREAGVGRQLLTEVQAGLPPDGMLLFGRQAQTVRWQAMGVLQDVSALMRSARSRYGAAPEVAERVHRVAGNWFAVPLYQRLVGHWIYPGVDASSLLSLRDSFAGAGGKWGIGPADTEDVDGWCWNAIHAWGGTLAERSGERVTLASAETAAALAWLASTFSDPAWRDAVHPGVAEWSDAQKNHAFVAGETAYTYTERGLPQMPPAGAGKVTPLLVPAPASPVGPVSTGGTTVRPRAVGGGAAWLLPRGAKAEPVERLWEALLRPEVQRRLWAAGAGFALPAFESGWSDPAVGALPNQESVRPYREQLATGGFVSYVGQGGPETGASQAVRAARLAARMLGAVARGRSVSEVLADATADAVAVYREHGLPGV